MPYVEELLNRDHAAHLRLYFFVRDVEELLEQVMAARFILLASPLRETLFMAWEEYRREALPRLLEVLEAGPNANYSDYDWSDLGAAGLEGEALHAKLTAYAEARMTLLSRGGRWALKRSLRWINTLLGSLCAVLPPAEALKELKETIENGAQDVEDLERVRLTV